MYDKVDYILLRICKDAPGKPLTEVITDFLEVLPVGLPLPSEHTLRDRMNALEDNGMVRLDRLSLKRRIFCYISEAGEKYLEGRMKEPVSGEVSPS